MRSLTPITLPADPTEDLHAATKQYVDDNAGGSPDAEDVVFDPTGLTNTDAMDVQEAIEDLDGAISSGGIAGTIFDAKGDLIVASAADTPARLAVGTNGHVLTADSAETTGVKWAVASGTSLPDLEWLEPVGGSALVNAQAHSANNRGVVRPVYVAKDCTLTHIRLNIGTSSGNISVAVYDSGFARLGTSGSVASPGTGWQDVALTSSVALTAGLNWLFVSANNTTITFNTVNVSGTSAPFCTLMETAHPAPATYVPGAASRGPVMIGLVSGGIT